MNVLALKVEPDIHITDTHPLPSSARDEKSVAILLCTKNGSRFLEEQLKSYKRQTHSNWSLFISDDGSTDNTIAIIKRFATTVPNPVQIRLGPKQGLVQNFLSLLADPAIKADYFAYSDQDDIWFDNKLERAITWHETIPQNRPALYCARAQIISEHGRDLGLSPLYSRTPSFKNALVENIASGNTSVFNNATRDLLRSADESIVLHDWWTYQIVTACGGDVWYDPKPCLKYRQHKNNAIGSNDGLAARIKQVARLCSGHFKSNIDRNLKGLGTFDNQYINHEAKKVLECLKIIRADSLKTRLAGFREAGVYRQSVLGNMGLIAATIFRKL